MNAPQPFSMLRQRLKALRNQADMTVRETSAALDLSETGYAYYEGREFKGPFIPMDLARKLVRIWVPRGVDSGSIMELAGSTAFPAGAGLRLPEAIPYKADADDQLLIRALAPNARTADLWEMRGDALNLAGLLAGDVLVVDLADVTPVPGDTVCASVYRRDGSAEATVFRIFEPPFHLVARSTDAGFNKPLIADGENVVIKGRVLASFRRHRPAPATE